MSEDLTIQLCMTVQCVESMMLEISLYSDKGWDFNTLILIN